MKMAKTVNVGTSYKNNGTYGVRLLTSGAFHPEIKQTIDVSNRDTLKYWYKINQETVAGNLWIFVDGDLKKSYGTVGSYTYDEIDISEYSGEVEIKFVCEGDTGIFELFLDGIEVTGPPQPLTPINGTTINGTFPPLTADVNFTWLDTGFEGYDSYRFQLSTNSGFADVTEKYISANNTELSLSEDDYFWRVAHYNSTTEDTGNWSTTYNFDINLTTEGITGTVIDGIVYETTDEGNIAIGGALVTITNSTWSDHILTGSNGYYYFDELKGIETYSIQTTKQGYVDSQSIYATTINNTTLTKNLLLERRSGAGDQYNFHYVEFIVKNIWDTRYTDVATSVYEEDSVVTIYTGNTGYDGKISFILNEDQEYRLTFINATQGINEEIVLYPKLDSYNVYVVTTSLAPDDQYSVEELETTVSKQIINNSHAYINVTYLDNLNETTGLNVYLNQSIANDPFNQTVIDSYLGAANSTTVSFIVEDYAGQTYFTNIDITHTTFDSVQRSFAVSFDGMEDAHGFTVIYIWLAIGGVMFTGMLWKPTTAKYGMLIVCACAWMFIILGWFDNLGTKGVLSIAAGTTLATILSIAAIMAKGYKEG